MSPLASLVFFSPPAFPSKTEDFIRFDLVCAVGFRSLCPRRFIKIYAWTQSLEYNSKTTVCREEKKAICDYYSDVQWWCVFFYFLYFLLGLLFYSYTDVWSLYLSKHNFVGTNAYFSTYLYVPPFRCPFQLLRSAFFILQYILCCILFTYTPPTQIHTKQIEYKVNSISLSSRVVQQKINNFFLLNSFIDRLSKVQNVVVFFSHFFFFFNLQSEMYVYSAWFSTSCCGMRVNAFFFLFIYSFCIYLWTMYSTKDFRVKNNVFKQKWKGMNKPNEKKNQRYEKRHRCYFAPRFRANVENQLNYRRLYFVASCPLYEKRAKKKYLVRCQDSDWNSLYRWIISNRHR